MLDAAGEQVGRVEDFIAKLTDGGYPPITGLKVGVGGHDVFVGRKLIEKLEPGSVRLNTNTIDMTAFQRRPGEVLDTVPIRLPRPRGEHQQGDPAFIQASDRIWGLIKSQAQAALLEGDALAERG